MFPLEGGGMGVSESTSCVAATACRPRVGNDVVRYVLHKLTSFPSVLFSFSDAAGIVRIPSLFLTLFVF